MSQSVVSVRIELEEVRPKIWRRVVVPVSISLEILHYVVQIAFGWWNYHLWQFEINDDRFTIPDDELEDPYEDGRQFDAVDFDLEWVIEKGVKRFSYLYDFGDHWVHDITLGEVEVSEARLSHPILVGGARCRPPEDVGGVYGFYEFVEIMKNPSHEEYEDYKRWYGCEYDPELFDREKVSKDLKQIKFRYTGSARSKFAAIIDPKYFRFEQ